MTSTRTSATAALVAALMVGLIAMLLVGLAVVTMVSGCAPVSMTPEYRAVLNTAALQAAQDYERAKIAGLDAQSLHAMCQHAIVLRALMLAADGYSDKCIAEEIVRQGWVGKGTTP